MRRVSRQPCLPAEGSCAAGVVYTILAFAFPAKGTLGGAYVWGRNSGSTDELGPAGSGDEKDKADYADEKGDEVATAGAYEVKS